MKLWKYTGILYMGAGLIHNICGVVFGWPAIQGIIDDGIIHAVNPDSDRLFVVWFLVCGLLIYLLGYLCHVYIKENNKPVPRFLGWYTLISAILISIVLPTSGIWMFYPIAFVIIFSRDEKTSERLT